LRGAWSCQVRGKIDIDIKQQGIYYNTKTPPKTDGRSSRYKKSPKMTFIDYITLKILLRYFKRTGI
jgi:hypothetical protein